MLLHRPLVRLAGGPWRLGRPRLGTGSHGGSGQARRPGGPKPGARREDVVGPGRRRLLARSSKLPWRRLGHSLGDGG
jgi:hypothetical protein